MPWRSFGEVETQKMVKEGLLREEHWVAATAWQEGFWLTKSMDVDNANETFPPFYAKEAFKKQFVTTSDGNEIVE